jgi:hypothetical protein
MDPAGDFGAISHLDLLVVFGDAFDLRTLKNSWV